MLRCHVFHFHFLKRIQNLKSILNQHLYLQCLRRLIIKSDYIVNIKLYS